ncbi:hypothetical protein [Candidatus Palauibacter sp.]|uniref:hypothetical protein n=1 Tax=Candidatus Palauibacter sp. TaxID=3101350 RepID=UPI003AF2D2E9
MLPRVVPGGGAADGRRHTRIGRRTPFKRLVELPVTNVLVTHSYFGYVLDQDRPHAGEAAAHHFHRLLAARLEPAAT